MSFSAQFVPFSVKPLLQRKGMIIHLQRTSSVHLEGRCQDNKLLLFKAINSEQASGRVEKHSQMTLCSPLCSDNCKRENNVYGGYPRRRWKGEYESHMRQNAKCGGEEGWVFCSMRGTALALTQSQLLRSRKRKQHHKEFFVPMRSVNK